MANDILKFQIIDKIAEMLGDIKKGSGYYTTIREVNKVDTSVEQITQFPAVNIIVGPTTYLNPEKNEAGRLMKTLNIVLDVYYEANDETEKQSMMAKLEADLEIRFCDNTINGNTNYNMDATAGNLENKCGIVLPVSSVAFSLDEYTDKMNFEWEFDVKFRQKRNDPTTQY